MKKLFVYILTAVMLLSVLAPAALAAETEETAPETTEAAEETEPARRPSREEQATSGTCGSLNWKFENGTLTVSGSGEMESGAPWGHLRDSIKTLVLTGGVTTVADEAFKDCDAITRIDFGGSLVEIGSQAFMDCDGLTSISLPATFRKFGPQCFMDCSGLTEVYCAGNMPSFKGEFACGPKTTSPSTAPSAIPGPRMRSSS